MTREEKLATFTELSKRPGLKTGRVFADELQNTVRLLMDHPAAGRPWRILGPADVPGFYHLASLVPVGLDYYQSRFDYIHYELVLHESQFTREEF
jgi:hypothetical protein